MKKLLLMVVAMLMTINVNAQQEVGSFAITPKVGLNLAELTKLDGSIRAGLVAGLEGQYQVSDLLGISLGAFYSMEGERDVFKYLSGSVWGGTRQDLKLDYINVPIMARFYIIKGLSAAGGLQFGFLTNSKYGSVDVKDMMNKMNLSISLGAGYEFSNIFLDARYNIGVSKVVKKEYVEDGATVRSDVVSLTIGYKFQL